MKADFLLTDCGLATMAGPQPYGAIDDGATGAGSRPA